ncbi:AfsR/SARP family transcriptional regulator [Micromonospora violae]|nr:BTAD domain-containing putative transcriptional regulator [Micromonospora violae]
MHANERVSRHKIVSILWTAPPRSWQQQLHNAASALRAFVRTGDGEVQLHSDGSYLRLQVSSDRLDTLEFQAAIAAGRSRLAEGRAAEAREEYGRAVGLWRGPIPDPGYPEGAEFAARLEGMFVDLVEELAQLKLDAGEPAEAVPLLASQVAAHPLRESLRMLYMRALWQSGRPAEALTVFERGRQILADELGVDPNADLRNLHAAILRGTYDKTAEPSDEPPAPHPVAARAPRLLPHTPHEFTGRTEELRLLQKAASNGTSTLAISAIDGMGGVGKTALAIRFAHEISDDFPDGQFFVDLRGFTNGKEPLTPEQALGVLLRDAGLSVESVESDGAGRAAQWRSLMAGKQALVVLDNAVDAAQVRPLLPGTGGSLVVITSRRRLVSLEGAVPLSVDTLPLDDGIALFRQVCGEDRSRLDDEAVAEVVRLCGQLPLATRIAAARFRHRPTWSIDDLVRQLRHQHTRTRLLASGDRSVVVALSLSYRHLTTTQQRIFRLLSQHPATEFDGYSVAALAGISVPEAEASLEALFDDNVVLQPRAGRYQLHDLIRDAAQQLHEQYGASTDGRRAAERVVDYYLSLARAWCGPLAIRPFAFEAEQEVRETLPERPPGVTVREALEGERVNFVAAIRLALREGMHRRVWQLTCSLQPLLALRNFEGDSLEVIRSAVTSARIAGDRDGECLALYALALATRERRESGLAATVFTQAIEAAAELGNAGWQAYQYADLGSAQLNSGQPQQARSSFQAGLHLAAEAGDPFAVHLLNNNLSVVSRELGAYDDAMRHLDAAEAALPELPVEAMLWMNVNRAMVLSQQGSDRAAYERFAWVLEQATAARSYRRIGIALLGLSSVSRAMWQAEPALEFGRGALEIAQQFRLREIECVALTCIGEALLELDRPAESVEVFNRASSRADEYGFTRYTARAQEGLAHERARAGDLDAARQHWQRAVERCPDGFVDAAGPKRHLEAADVRAVECDRCRHASREATDRHLGE